MALVQEHNADLWRYLRFLGCDGGLAEDLVQETFLRVWKRPFEDRGQAARGAYLRKVARSLYLKQVRKLRRGATLTELDLEEAELAWTEYVQEDDGEQYRGALQQCLGKLSERSQQALVMFYRDRRSREEIAEALGMKPNGIKTLMRRSRETLRECISRRLAPGTVIPGKATSASAS